jgi:hypothetical protein
MLLLYCANMVLPAKVTGAYEISITLLRLPYHSLVAFLHGNYHKAFVLQLMMSLDLHLAERQDFHIKLTSVDVTLACHAELLAAKTFRKADAQPGTLPRF